MKKSLRILSVVVCSFLIILSLMLAACGGCNKNEENEVTETLESVSVDTSNATLIFFIGDSFTSEGIVVTATIRKSDSEELETRDVTSEASVNSLTYDNTKAGIYTITVGYTLSAVTKSDTYDVEVKELKAGVQVKLKEGVASEYNLSDTAPTVNLSDYASWVEVRQSDNFGFIDETSSPISESLYSVDLYLGDVKINDNSDYDLTALDKGAYQIWVTLNAQVEGFTVDGFALIYVYDAEGNLTDPEEVVLKSGSIELDMADLRSDRKTSVTGGEVLAQTVEITVAVSSTISDGTLDASSKSNWTVRLKIGGAIEASESAVKNALAVTVTQACTVTLHVRSSSSSASRAVDMFCLESGALVNKTNNSVEVDNSVWDITFTIDTAGTYYFGSTSGGIGVYGIDVTLSE